MNSSDKPKVTKTEAERRKQLTPEQYHVTREHGTERAFAGPYWNEKAGGEYHCVCCGASLFSSATKFDSGTGWPSFWAPVDKNAVDEHSDRSFFMKRTEITCASCDAHLGHVFLDGPKPTGALLHQRHRAHLRAARRREQVTYELLSMCARNSAMEPNRTVPCGSCASIEPSV
jgi:peptide-methionine (R)-S-oxide reductase